MNPSFATVVARKKIAEIRSKFHRDRHLLVKHLPRDVAVPEIMKVLSDFDPIRVEISSSGEKSSKATVTLRDPTILEDWDHGRHCLLRKQTIAVAPSPTDSLLCVTGLPESCDEAAFHQLMRRFGTIETFFLMTSERTGGSKGYGFVRYTLHDTAVKAKCALNGKAVGGGGKMVCEWLKTSCITVKDLHAKCLYVDNLPPNFRDMGLFRETFAKVVNPPYCQLGLKNGRPLEWGLVEYLKAEEAEMAKTALDGTNFLGRPLRVTYYVPAVRAIYLYEQLLNASEEPKAGGGLLPDPAPMLVLQSIEKLSKQNASFAHNLQNIIMNEMEEMKVPVEKDVKGNKAKSVLETPLKAPPTPLWFPPTCVYSNPTPAYTPYRFMKKFATPVPAFQPESFVQPPHLCMVSAFPSPYAGNIPSLALYSPAPMGMSVTNVPPRQGLSYLTLPPLIEEIPFPPPPIQPPSQTTTPPRCQRAVKRKLPPSPEKSPPGNYIGQHSQGIGGHYADSYFRKKVHIS